MEDRSVVPDVNEGEMMICIRHVSRSLASAMALRAHNLGTSREAMLLDMLKEEFSNEEKYVLTFQKGEKENGE